MKFVAFLTLLTLFFTLTKCNPIANPEALAEAFAEPESEADAEALLFDNGISNLEKRSSCSVGSYSGTCVDVRKDKQCKGGILVPDHCGGGNTNICCLKGYTIVPKGKSGMGSKPKAKSGSGKKPKAKSGSGKKPKAGMGSKPKTGSGSKPKEGMGSKPKSGTGSAPKVGWGNKPI